ncbi:heterokaryon incompatibility protein-domain-containing protein [Aspergillus californicus]
MAPSNGSQPPDSWVCELCRTRLFRPTSFLLAWAATRLTDGYSYMTTWEQVSRSASEGCRWCRLLEDNVNKSDTGVVWKVTVNFSALKQASSKEVTPNSLRTLRVVVNNAPNCVFYLYTTADNPAARHIHARNVIGDVSSKHSYELALDCMRECILHHSDCPNLPRKTPLPTRVIDCAAPAKPRLFLTNDQEISCYAALSYVWGEKQPQMTTTQNIDSYINPGIDISMLPRTIRDAITATHSLGLRYLWADSMCILQDSREDKDYEIARMRHVFSHAHITLIAASASQVSGGFLQSRNKPADDTWLPFFPPAGATTTSTSSSIGTIALSPVWKQYDETQEPVNQRAWCLEERLLSPRSLIYAAHTLQYHCQTHTVNIGNSICGPRSGRRLPPALLFLAESPSLLSDSEEFVRAWYDVVEDYTRRTVTKQRDKLLAVSGIVDLFSRVWGDKGKGEGGRGGSRYLAGLWHHLFPRDLLWLKDYQDMFSRPTQYRAPSWSWASTDGHIVPAALDDSLNPEKYKVEECEVVDCCVTLANNQLPLGRVTGGILTIRGPLKRVLWDPQAEWPRIFEHRGSSTGCSESDPGDGKTADALGYAYPDSLDEASQAQNGTTGDRKPWALPVMWSVESKAVAGLILVEDECGDFRRVGFFSSDNAFTDAGGGWLRGSDRIITIV